LRPYDSGASVAALRCDGIGRLRRWLLGDLFELDVVQAAVEGAAGQ
jgi:hypothetical protein